jgi:methylmalonyl-CoA mutase N-terminal domain/subunit
MERMSESGLPVDAVYDESKLTDFRPEEKLGSPGEYPFTRGVYPRMYVDRPWTMRQYAGFASAAESNQRYHELIANGTTGLSVAFDLPTQMGYDSDAPIAHGEVGKVGVAIDSADDMRTLFGGIDLGKVSTSMTINAPAAMLLLMYQTVGEEQGASPAALTGTIQNDVLKEYIARGTYIYPPRPSLRLVADTFKYCRENLPKWNTISISGYHMAEAGATPVQEIAFTLANAREYVRAALSAGLHVDEFAPRLSFFFVARTTLLEEVAKFRAARRLWAKIMKDEFGARDPRSQMLRFHTQTAGVQLTAQQPEVNLVRVSIQALAAVLGGTQSLHTNSFDEALALQSAKAARLALRTQQVIAYESDLTQTVDPFAGSYAIESMTDAVEAAASELMERVEQLGGAVAAIERGFQKEEIEQAAYEVSQQIDSGNRTVVGVNKFITDDNEHYDPLKVDPAIEQDQARRLARLRESRDTAAVRKATDVMKKIAESNENVLYPLRDALRAGATLGETCDALREVWGEYSARLSQREANEHGHRLEPLARPDPRCGVGSTAHR